MNWSKRRVRRGPMLDDILSAPTPIETPIKACVSCGRTKDDAATLAAKAVDEGNEQEELQVLKVEQILIKIPEGEERRSRCWKVTVAPQFSAQMMKPESYPSVWGWRKWHKSRPQSSQGSQGERTDNVGA